jgi:hypothetical protein
MPSVVEPLVVWPLCSQYSATVLKSVAGAGRCNGTGSSHVSGASVKHHDPELRVYSAGVVPALGRIVTTTTDMDKDVAA